MVEIENEDDDTPRVCAEVASPKETQEVIREEAGNVNCKLIDFTNYGYSKKVKFEKHDEVSNEKYKLMSSSKSLQVPVGQQLCLRTKTKSHNGFL